MSAFVLQPFVADAIDEATSGTAAAMSAVKRPAAATSLPPPDWYDTPDDKTRLQNYLVTAAKLVNVEDTTSKPPLSDPAKISKEEFQASLQDSLDNPMYGFGRPRTRAVELFCQNELVLQKS